ncbi:MAG: hypothetical protein GX089_02435 [Fibrobacter sp.]|jgi:hypothetical protein|nr:hypothetical protein [Fibrobacter sp.]HON11289.1 hypothetical protein [Chitinispirillaceae bacterium]
MIINQQSLFFFDISTIILMTVLAYLSKRLGEALKIGPYYKVLYGTGLLIILAICIDMINDALSLGLSFTTISVLLRFAAGAMAFFVSLKYWKWLFSEFFRN